MDSMIEPGLREVGSVELSDGKTLRVTFDIPVSQMCVIRKDRQIKVDYTEFTPAGLARQFEYGARMYNDAAAAAGKIDEKNDKGRPIYINKDAFLDACVDAATKCRDATKTGQSGRSRETIGDPVEREMLRLGFSYFAKKGWTKDKCPASPGSKNTVKCKDYGEFKDCVKEFLAKNDEVFRIKAIATLKEQKELDDMIEDTAEKVDLASL